MSKYDDQNTHRSRENNQNHLEVLAPPNRSASEENIEQ